MTGTTALEAMPDAPRRRPSPLVVVTGVVGELLITAGVLLGLFVVWQLWWTDVEAAATQRTIMNELGWAPPVAQVADDGVAEPQPGDPPVPAVPEHGETFATLLVPRWGEHYQQAISGGIDRETVLDPLGIGYYPSTQLPGELGNFALAGHRVTYGKPFNKVEELEVGDPVVVRTKTTWYVYRVVSTRVVTPQQTEVIAPVPGDPGAEPTKRFLTMTTCHPMFSLRERFVVHAVLDEWARTADGVPAALTGGA